ncbi:MAG TPA: hypothetical protein VMH83_13745, partial [Candidatus Acidoferrum sp.]|nr:hypothetical protein [Candidatus Acidoferrum sp.]
MTKLRSTACLLLANLSFATAAYAQQVGHDEWNTLQTYCSKCHNLDDFNGKFALDLLEPNDLTKETAR